MSDGKQDGGKGASKGDDLDLNALLAPEELALFERHMEVRDDYGAVAVSAGRKMQRMLHLLVTATGHSNEAGGLHLSRNTVLPLLIQALVGDNPDADIWIEALGRGTFDLSEFAGFLNPDAERGTPGTMLPRLLQRYERTRDGRNARKGTSADLSTALRLLITGMLIRELQRAVSAGAALGPAWPLMRAVRHRSDAKLRRLLTDFGGEEAFLNHMRHHLHVAVDEWATRKSVRRSTSTDEEADTKPPTGVDVAGYFARGDDADQRREDALAAFGKLVLGVELDVDDVSRRALKRVAREVPHYAELKALVDPPFLPSMRYLDEEPEPLRQNAFHRDHLRMLMPMLAAGVESEKVMACAIGAVGLADDGVPNETTSVPLVDIELGSIGRAIYRYARDIGPPPPAAALAHLPYFQASACYLSLAPSWPARDAWAWAGFQLADPDPDLFRLLTNMAGPLKEGTSLKRFDVISLMPFW